jgi:lysophospholipase L1-like esterase
VDLTEVMAGVGKDYYLDADPVHFNTQGNARIAETLLEQLKVEGVVPMSPQPTP